MGEPVRVAQIIGKALQTGVDTMVMNYYRHINQDQIQFDFFMDGLEDTVYDNEIPALGGKIFKLPPYDKDMRANLYAFREILQTHSYSIVHSHMNTLSVFWLREAKRAGIPIRIAHSHSTASKGEGRRVLMKYLLRPFSKLYPTHLAACSQYAGEWLFGKKTSAFLVYNAINLEAFQFDPEVRDKLRTDMGIADKFVIGHVGRFAYQKNHKFLIEIFKEVRNRKKEAVLLLVGDGELRSEIEDQVNDYGLGDSVIFLGSRSDMPRLYQAMDMFALPSHFEGLPVSAVEAQVAGLPCLLSEAITREVGLTKQSAFIPLDVQAWSEQILECHYHERENTPPIDNGFDIKQAAPRLCEFYTHLLKEGV